jgi:GTP cyclohydrolase I
MQHEMDPLSPADLAMEMALLPEKRIGGPTPGDVLVFDGMTTAAKRGDVWTGYEWVSPERYKELREVMNLPPMQPVPSGVRGELLSSVVTPIEYELSVTADTPEECKQGVIALLLSQIIGEDTERGGLKETPARVVKAWQDWTSGYHKSAADILKVFEDGAEGCDEMVVVRDIPIYSHCEHHLAPIFGTATIGYLPDGKIVGLSKLNRLADMFARRLQVQERMTNQIADALMEHLAPTGCGVVITARHMCMESRGVCQSSNTVTSALRGSFKEYPQVRAEFLALARNGGA